jgi:hypothetical protein
VPLILLAESDRGTREAQADVWHLAHELWPEVDFPYSSEMPARRQLAVREAA